MKAADDGWETVTADAVRVGDEIEVTQEWGHGYASAVHRCRVFDITAPDEGRRRKVQRSPDEPDDYLWIGLRVEGKTETIRRRVRQPMDEPAAPAVVRHAGRLLARSEHETGTLSWRIISGPEDQRGYAWLAWSGVLALDPDTDPVPVDLGEA